MPKQGLGQVCHTECPALTVLHTLADREVQRILLELLNQMDGFDQNVNVKVQGLGGAGGGVWELGRWELTREGARIMVGRRSEPSCPQCQVIMATNRADTLDPALLRPGRLDRKIEFPLPDRRQKRLIFSTITSKMNLSEEVDLEDCILLWK